MEFFILGTRKIRRPLNLGGFRFLSVGSGYWENVVIVENTLLCYG